MGETITSPKQKRIGAVSFLNTKPLVHSLIQSPIPDIKLSLGYPSLLSDQLEKEELDLALIPIIEYFRQPSYRIIPDICIASKGRVQSILLFSQKPLSQCNTVGLDSSSRTSQALVKILLAEYWKIHPEFVDCSPNTQPSNHEADAVLLIGDQALRYRKDTRYVFDLGEIWQQLTGLPFVYACWVGRSNTKLGDIGRILNQAKDEGLSQIDIIASEEAEKLGFSFELCHRYLTKHIFFNLGSEEIDGLEYFYQLAQKYDLVPTDRSILFFNS